MALTRENIRDGYIQRMIAEGDAGIRTLSEAELKASRSETMAAGAAGQEVWVFAYGSLIWNPAFHFAERQIGMVHGYHRRFCLWTHLGRGSPERPGLTLGLEPGGCCRGIAYRVAADAVDTELEIVWRREMVSGAYRPRWVDVRLGNGRPGNGRTGNRRGRHGPGGAPGSDGRSARAITFVINRGHERYACKLSDEQVADAIAKASGQLGNCADYLFNTVAHLEELDIQDRGLARLCELVTRART